MRNNVIPDVITDFYDGSGKYAKVLEIPIGKYQQAIFINTFHMSFRVYWVNAYGYYRYKDYSIVFKSATEIIFNELTPDLYGYDVRAYVDNTNHMCTVYVCGSATDAYVQVKMLHCNAPYCIGYLQNEPFTEDFATLPEIEPTPRTTPDIALYNFSNGWSLLSSAYQKVKRNGNSVTVNAVFTGGTLAGGTNNVLMAKLPVGSRPTSTLFANCVFKKGDGTYATALLKVGEFGDLLIYSDVTSNVEVIINLTFNIA